MAHGKLASYDLTGGVTQSIYQCDTDKYATLVLSLCNRGTNTTKLTVAITSAESAIGADKMIEFESELLPKNTLERTGIIVPSGSYVTILSTSSDVSAVAYGVVVGNAISTTPIVTATDSTAPQWITPTSITWPQTLQVEADDPGDLTYSVTSGSLPDGLSMNTAGAISGTPSTVGNSGTPTVLVTDPSGNTNTRTFTITTTEATQPVINEYQEPGGGGGGAPAEPEPDPVIIGEHVFNSPGTYSWTAPDFVTSVSVVAVGGGGGGAGDHDGTGGGGGGLGWKNNITVVPGNSYTVVVGSGGAGGNGDGTYGTAGTVSYFNDAGTVAGYGGDRGIPNQAGNVTINGGSYVGDGGGAGGDNLSPQSSHRHGGGGAGGYAGQGGIVPQSYTTSGGAGQGGGGGAGAGGNNYQAGGGGGTGIYGQGSSGAGGSYGNNPANPGQGGSTANSTGTSGTNVQFGGGSRGDGGFPGGAGGGTWYGNGTYGGYVGGNGGGGAVRIVFGPGREFPTNLVAQANSEGNVSTN